MNNPRSYSRRKNRAIALVTTLISLVLLLMLMGAALTTMRSSAALSGSAQENQAALQAAQAGLNYARTRLQERPTWKGDGDGSTTSGIVVRTADDSLVVVEDNGNVIGYMRSAEGKHSQFRFRFNWHNGGAGSPPAGDGLPDPSGYFIPGPFVSTNNLSQVLPTPVYRAVDMGGGVWEVDGSAPPNSPGQPYNCPRYCANILAEGLAGPGLSDQLNTPASPDPVPNGGRVSTRLVEANFRRTEAVSADAVIYSARNISATGVGEFEVTSEQTTVPPRIRSNADITISGTYDTPSDGEVYTGTSGTFSAGSGSPTVFNEDTTDFFDLQWSQVKKASPATAMRVRGGTYIWRAGSPNYLEYYPQAYDPNTVYAPGAGTVVNSAADMQTGGPAGALTLDPGALKLEFTDDVYVDAADPNDPNSPTGFAVVPEVTTLARPWNEFKEKADGSVPVLTSVGTDGIWLRGELSGQGSVTTEGDIHFQGPSALEVTPDASVAVYSKQDIILEAIVNPPNPAISSSSSSGPSGTSAGTTPTTGTAGPGSGAGAGISGTLPPPATLTYNDQAYAGVLFAMGDFRADLLPGTPAEGQLFIRGVLVAYGGDPDAGDLPGAAGNGVVDIRAKNAQFRFDNTFVDNLLDVTAAAHLQQTLFAIL